MPGMGEDTSGLPGEPGGFRRERHRAQEARGTSGLTGAAEGAQSPRGMGPPTRANLNRLALNPGF